MLLQASERAKTIRKYTIWFAATGTPENPDQLVNAPGELQQRLQRFLQFLIVPGLQVTVGSFLQEVLYFFHSHFLTFFQQLLLFGGLANS